MATRSVQLEIGSKLSPGGKKALADMKRGISRIGRHAKKVLNFGKYMAIGAGAAGFAFLAKGTRDALTFGRGMAEVGTLLNYNSKQMQGLSREVLDLSRSTGRGATELTAGLYQTVSAGVKAGQMMQFLGKSTKAAIGGVSSVKTAVDLTTSVLDAYGLSTKKAGMVNDIAFKTVKMGKTTYSELAQGIGQVLPFSSSLNVSLVDLFSTIATLTKGGIDTASAMTFLKGMLVAVQDPASAAAEAAKKLGLNFTAAELRAKGLAGFMAQLGQAVARNPDVLTKLFPNMRAQAAAMALTGKLAEKFVDIQKEIADFTGASGQAFADIARSDAYKFDKALNSLKVTGIVLGLQVLPAVTDAIRALSPIISRVSGAAAKWLKANKELIGQKIAEYARTLGAAVEVSAKWVWKTVSGIVEWVKENPRLAKTIAILAAAQKTGILPLVVSMGRLLVMLPGIAKGFWGAATAAKAFAAANVAGGAAGAAGAGAAGAAGAAAAKKAGLLKYVVAGGLVAGVKLAAAGYGGYKIGEYFSEKSTLPEKFTKSILDQKGGLSWKEKLNPIYWATKAVVAVTGEARGHEEAAQGEKRKEEQLARLRRFKDQGRDLGDAMNQAAQQAADAVKVGIEEGLRRRNAQAAVLAPG